YVAIQQLCISSLSFIKQQALNKRIQLHTQIPPLLPDLWVDAIRIRQVLLNLLTNAVKFTPEEGHITLAVTLLTPDAHSSPQPQVRIAVTDTGIGIAADDIPKLFKPFVQIDASLNRQHSGTGLGLMLVKQIVELHGGTVGLTSTLGEGSCFTIDLPYDPQTSANWAALANDAGAIAPVTLFADADGNAPAPSSQAPLILLAEDNGANIVTIAGYLQAKGYRLIYAESGEEAIAQAMAHHPDVIVMDIQMPGMDGLEAMRQIRQQENLRGMQIIALTALAMKGDRERCIEAGANHYLSKPVRLKHLDLAIKELLAVSGQGSSLGRNII
ncbi:MAG: ATP-binding protein, partial [Leptolyngbyaceae bacterium]|nr:ATP-binding protein [Leptolyngbyaceae bacterium]